MTGSSQIGPVAWRWRYRGLDGSRTSWTVRQSPIEDRAATTTWMGIESEPLFTLAPPINEVAYLARSILSNYPDHGATDPAVKHTVVLTGEHLEALAQLYAFRKAAARPTNPTSPTSPTSLT